MRPIAAVALLVVLAVAGCGSSEKKKANDHALELGAFETNTACQAFAEKLKGFTVEGTPSVRVGTIRNETDQGLDTRTIADSIRDKLVESKKFVVLAEGTEPPADYVVTGKVSSQRMKSGESTSVSATYRFDVVDQKRAIVLSSRSEFRKEQTQ